MDRLRSAVSRRGYARWGAVALVGLFSVWFVVPVAAQGDVVVVSPAGPSVTEGGSTTLVLSLSEPIIGPGPDPVVVELTLTADDPSRITLPSPTVTWSAAEWAQSRSVTVLANADGVFNDDDLVTLSGVVDSGSEYYDGYAVEVSVSVADLDPAPTSSTTTSVPDLPTTSMPSGAADPSRAIGAAGAVAGPPEELAMTAAPDREWLVLGLALVAVGVALSAASRRRM